MEFPRHLHKSDGLYVVVRDDAQYDAAKAHGWADRPDAHVEKPVEVRFVDAVRDEIAAEPIVDAPADDAPKAKKGKKVH